jgi:SAM-dependent MidA family methyltransferase
MTNQLEWIQEALGDDRSSMPFVEFMELALYHPVKGYYVTKAMNIGARGDFYTSPHLSPLFGECLACQVIDCWEIMGQPIAFELIEMGAGQGILAADILQAIAQICPELSQALTYSIIERSQSLKLAQQHHLASWGSVIQWREWETIEPESIQGCFISNELVDAFPVHQVVWQDQTLQEVYVSFDGDRITEQLGPLSTPELQQYFDRLGINFQNYPDGYRTEVNLNAIQWIQTITNKLHHGYVLTIDYGYSADRYYNSRRTGGTLQCYYQHQVNSNPYMNVGLQDITAHVDFTTLVQRGEEFGLTSLGLTQQAYFLMALGLGDRIAALSQTETQNVQEINDRLQTRTALHQLIDPTGLGNFCVLIQSKNLSATESGRSLRGLTVPERFPAPK